MKKMMNLVISDLKSWHLVKEIKEKMANLVIGDSKNCHSDKEIVKVRLFSPSTRLFSP